MKIKLLSYIFWVFSLPFFTLSLLVQSSVPLSAESNSDNLDDLPGDPEQMISWTCGNQNNRVLVEAKNDNVWKSVIEQNNWTCQEGLSDTSTGALKFTCEPTDEQMISLLTVTWLTGNDQDKQMGQWLHQFADEHNMICRMAKVELWG